MKRLWLLPLAVLSLAGAVVSTAQAAPGSPALVTLKVAGAETGNVVKAHWRWHRHHRHHRHHHHRHHRHHH